MARLFGPENVVHIEDIITIFVVITIVLKTFAGLREDSPRISRGLVLEIRVANSVGGRQLRCQCLKRLQNT
jgi:hypothetical protein